MVAMLLFRNQIVTDMYLEVNKNDHVQGSVNAPIEIIEYADFQCPYCGKAYHIVKEIQKKFGDKIKYVFRNFPLTGCGDSRFLRQILGDA